MGGSTPTMPANERRVRHGGLMRCCLHTLAESTEETEVGDTMHCRYETDSPSSMIVAVDGVWEWNHD